MKKLFFIFFLAITSLVYGANVYFDYPFDGQTYFSNTNGRANMSYHILNVNSHYFLSVGGYSARIQYPDGHWSDWQSGQSGGWNLTQAGTYHIQGHVYVYWDYRGDSNYDMYSNILTFYIVDTTSPSAPQNLSIGANPGNNLVKLSWSANSEYDLSLYEVSRKIDEFGTGWLVILSNNYKYFLCRSGNVLCSRSRACT